MSRTAVLRALPLLLGAALVSASPSSAAPSRAAVPVGGAPVLLASNVLPGLDQLVGTPAAADQVLDLGVALRRPDVAGENALYAAQYDPKSPEYLHFLTPAQFAQRFGVQAERVADVRAWLEGAGLVVDHVSTDGAYLSLHGTVAAVQKAFHVEERTYTSKGVSFVANTTGPAVPALDGITTVVGLNTLQKFSRQTTSSLAPSQSTCAAAAGTCTGSLTPKDLWHVYQQPDAYRGKGQRIAIIGEGKETQTIANLRAAQSFYGLPATPLTVKCVQGTVADGSCGADDGGTGEWQIDTQASTGMAPDLAGETLYFAKTIYDPDLNNSFIQWAEDPTGPTIASASLGECESSPANSTFTSGPLAGTNANLGSGVGGTGAGQAVGNGEQQAVDPELKMAAMLGKTLFASTGDTGSSCPLVVLPTVGAGNGVANQGVPQQNYPAVSPYVVASGGTVLYTTSTGESAGSTYDKTKPAGDRAQEYGWTFSGGGSSLYTPEPDYQKVETAVMVPCPLTPTTTCRGVPDVSALSGDVATNGYSIVTISADGKNTVGFASGGGTSLSAPLLAGMWARVNQAAPSNLGQANPHLYPVGVAPASYARDFFDVTVGGNGAYVPMAGWDYVSGFGVPNVDGLICDIDHVPSGRYAQGVADACPLTAASTGAVTVVTGTTSTAPTASGTLASTGLTWGVPVAALVALGGALGLARRRRA